METKTLLREEVNREIEELGRLPLGKEEYMLTVDGATKLTDRLIELEKIEIEADARERDREIDTEIKLKQIDDEIKDKKIKNWISIGGTLLMAGITVWGALKSWDFEKEDTVASDAGKSFMARLIPRSGIGFK